MIIKYRLYVCRVNALPILSAVNCRHCKGRQNRASKPTLSCLDQSRYKDCNYYLLPCLSTLRVVGAPLLTSATIVLHLWWQSSDYRWTPCLSTLWCYHPRLWYKLSVLFSAKLWLEWVGNCELWESCDNFWIWYFSICYEIDANKKLPQFMLMVVRGEAF